MITCVNDTPRPIPPYQRDRWPHEDSMHFTRFPPIVFSASPEEMRPHILLRLSTGLAATPQRNIHNLCISWNLQPPLQFHLLHLIRYVLVSAVDNHLRWASGKPDPRQPMIERSRFSHIPWCPHNPTWRLGPHDLIQLWSAHYFSGTRPLKTSQ